MATGGDFLNGVGGGVKDHYGEDSATEDQLITPWNFSVARYLYTYIHTYLILISHYITSETIVTN
jgi:hypothetical protein